MTIKCFTPGADTGKILLAVENNASKIIRNWFFTIQPDIFKLFTIYQSAKNKEHGWHYNVFYSSLCTYIFMHFCERKKSFIKFPILILYLKL